MSSCLQPIRKPLTSAPTSRATGRRCFAVGGAVKIAPSCARTVHTAIPSRSAVGGDAHVILDRSIVAHQSSVALLGTSSARDRSSGDHQQLRQRTRKGRLLSSSLRVLPSPAGRYVGMRHRPSGHGENVPNQGRLCRDPEHQLVRPLRREPHEQA